MRAVQSSPRLTRRAAGFSMIEVLVAIAVIGIGLLGLAALQIFSVKANQSANYRTQATALAYDLMDRMRANRPGVVAGQYYAAFSGGTGRCTGAAPTTGPLAARDLHEWKCAVRDQLPSGDGRVQMPGGRIIVSIRWADARWSAGDPTAEFTLTSSL
ncbi:type IV pilus modification protein PilV [Tahibacter amnicola]|uniref:Type IV pilus modification protein PilV n=1 Tax=Tahibacter amnicola TaxID=2976241 RepID=A0ABY6B8B6_9GAMM|nr:type IV pilus modification protein PilV [Tahibacter amnicola]UXI66318.1 type IV pilus modification protein PilV [Tahibacter amnicola]